MAGRTKTHDKQIGRSRACIVEALFRLMEKLSYTKISVSGIIKKAGVSRQTFYRHYKSKDDVIFQFLERCFAPSPLDKAAPPASIGDLNKGYVYLKTLPLQKIIRHSAALKIILNSEAEHLVYQYEDKWKAHMVNLFKNKFTPQENIYFRYTVLFSISGSTQVICDWIKNDMPIPIEKLIEWLSEKGRALADNHASSFLKK
jgi:AcrR family transcriptional regulator